MYNKHNNFLARCMVFINKLLGKIGFRLICITNHPQHPFQTFNHDFIRIATLEMISQEIYENKRDGAVAELGVYQGKFASYINHFFYDRTFYMFDTFEGFSTKDVAYDIKENFSAGNQNFTNTSIELIKKRMPHLDKCKFIKGYFPESVQGLEEIFCYVSLDVDLYKPTLAGLEYFYPRLVHGGAIMIHDFEGKNYLGVRQAVTTFCDKNHIGYIRIADAGGSVVICK